MGKWGKELNKNSSFIVSNNSVEMISSKMVTKTDQVAATCEDNPVSRIPPEVWEMIAENVDSSKDLFNLNEVIPTCAQGVYPRRVEWLFYQVLPLLITNLFGTFKILYRHDLFKCRLVCKHWKFGIDNFLENNVLHYPASGDNVDGKLERCHYAETSYYNQGNILGRELKTERLQKIMDKAVNSPCNPIVGRYIHILVPGDANGVSLVERFLETFGRHIYFLKIHLNVHSCPISNLQMLIRALPNLPNLKGLTISKFNCSEHKGLSKRKVSYRVKRELNNLKKNTISTDTFKNGLPKLETLNLSILDICGDILSQIILSMFYLEQLKSLEILEFFAIDKYALKLQNLLYLRLAIECNKQLKSVLEYSYPLVRKLYLEVTYEELDYDLLCQVLQKFQGNINHLTLNFPDDLDKNEIVTRKMHNFFTNTDMLNMPKIRTLTLLGQCPSSFNFLCGDGFKSLEYLHLYLDNKDEDGSEKSFSSSSSSSPHSVLLHDTKKPETIDIIEKLAPIWLDEPWDWKRPDMYNSNVWSVFPRLKCVAIARYEYWEPNCINGWKYRRDYLTGA